MTMCGLAVILARLWRKQIEEVQTLLMDRSGIVTFTFDNRTTVNDCRIGLRSLRNETIMLFDSRLPDDRRDLRVGIVRAFCTSYFEWIEHRIKE